MANPGINAEQVEVTVEDIKESEGRLQGKNTLENKIYGP